MKIVVVGGIGEVGLEVTRELARRPEVDELVVADIHLDKVREAAATLGSDHLSTVALDIRDRESSLRVLEGADVLMNCTSFVLFDTVINRAIEAGVNYADLISEPTDEHRRAVARAGITGISGLGATPGLSNVLVRHAAEAFDQLDEVHISWTSFRTIAPTPGLLDTIAWELSEDCDTRMYFQNGRMERAAAMDGSKLVEFAAPVGPQRVYFVPHTEVTSLPAAFPSLKFCAVRGSWRPELMEHMRILGHYGLLARDSVEYTKAQIWERLGGQRDQAPWTLFVSVEIVATHEERPVRRTYDVSHSTGWGQAGPGRMTGIPAAVGALLLARHGTSEAGFVDPELYYDPHEFLRELETEPDIEITWRDSI